MESEIERARAVLGHIENGAEKVAARAANRAINAARTVGVKRITKMYVIKAKDVNRNVKIRKATRSKLSAVIQEKSSPLPMVLFDVAPLNKGGKVGVFAKIKREKGRKKEIEGAFMAVATKYAGPFQRMGKERMPIEPLYGPSVAQMFGNEETVKAMEERGQEVLDERLEHEIDKMLGEITK